MKRQKPEQTLETKSTTALEAAQKIRIIDQRSYDAAVTFFEATALLKNQIVDHHKDMKSKAYAAWQSVIAAEKLLLTPVQNAYDLVARAIGTWDEQQRAKADELRRQMEEAANQRADEERERAAADAHRDGADEEEVAAILRAPTPSVKVQTVSSYVQSSTVSNRTRYSATPVVVEVPKTVPVKDREVWLAQRAFVKLIKLAAKNPAAYAKYLKLDESAINYQANHDKEAFSIPDAYTYATTTKAAPRGSSKEILNDL